MSSQIKVIQSYPVWLPQTQTWMYNQIRCLPETVESHILCDRTQNLDQFNLPNIHALEYLPSTQYLWDKLLRKLKLRRYLAHGIDVAQQYQATILHSHFGQIGWGDRGLAKRAGLKHVVTFYGQDVSYLPQQNPRWFQRYRQLFGLVDRVLCEGPHMASCVIQLGCAAEKVQVLHLGVSVDEIPFQPRVWQAGEPFRVLIAASFREKKGIPDAITALGQLQHHVPLEITIIGDASAEPRCQAEKQKILDAIAHYKLQSKIRMLGFQPHSVFFEEAYQHHLFLSPSVTSSDGDTEGGAPVSLIEVAASGMPIVSTTHCDIPEVIQHKVTGLLAPEHHVDQLVSHLKWFVDHPQDWTPMLNAARHWIEQEFDVYTQAQKLAKIYQELLD